MKRILVIALTLMACFAMNVNAQTKKKVAKAAPKTVVEVLYFHGKQRCPGCMAIGKYSKEAVYQSFAKQIKAGTVRYKEIDISTKDGEKIADRYHVTWSSFFINQWKNGKEKRNDMTRYGFENARSNPQVFKAKVKSTIITLLK
jgi:hypothetical protein